MIAFYQLDYFSLFVLNFSIELLSLFSRLHFSFSMNKTNRFAFLFHHELQYNTIKSLFDIIHACVSVYANFFSVRSNFQFSRIFKRQLVKRAMTKALRNKWIFLYELWSRKLNAKWNKRTEWKNNKLQRMCSTRENSQKCFVPNSVLSPVVIVSLVETYGETTIMERQRETWPFVFCLQFYNVQHFCLTFKRHQIKC